MNENLINDIKKFISIKNNFESKDKNKKSILSHLEDAIKQETEYYLLLNNIDSGLEFNSSNKDDDNNYNKEDLNLLKKIINKLLQPEVVSDDSLNNAFSILGNNSNRKGYINLCLNFVKYVNSNSFSNI